MPLKGSGCLFRIYIHGDRKTSCIPLYRVENTIKTPTYSGVKKTSLLACPVLLSWVKREDVGDSGEVEAMNPEGVSMIGSRPRRKESAMKRVARLLLVASLICGTASGAWALPGPTEGFVGVVIWVFLAYCALIVIAQLLVALHALRRLIEGSIAKKRVSRPVILR